MKITITHTADEEVAAAGILAALLRLLPGARVHRNVSRSPYIQIHLTTRRPGKP